jgi:solute:Na+ symporter, SSS family
MDPFLFTSILVLYLLLIGFLGYLGYRGTKSSDDFLIAGRRVHPYVMALSYGATFISTAAIVGFGGVAGLFGLSILWLPFMNIFFGIIIAFIFFGKRTRQMGFVLKAKTFPDLLGKRYNSLFMRVFGGIVIFLFMPIYAGVVLIGASRFLETTLNINYVVALMVFSVVIAAYVIAGGLKGVMYTDTLQGSIMIVGMIVLIIFTYRSLGGIISAHQMLSDLSAQVPPNLAEQGHMGWTMMPRTGSPIWWTMVSTIIAGVGIGVLAQPQLAVRFMTVKTNRQLNRAVLIGGIFVLFMTAVPYLVGALSNVFFFNQFGVIAVEHVQGNIDVIIPTFINLALPRWFVYIFMLSLLSAAMSTMSSQFHVIGTSISKDIFSRKLYVEEEDPKEDYKRVLFAKIGIVIGIIVTIFLGYRLPVSIIARGTALFFGICAAAFLPAFVCALFWRGVTKAAGIASMVVGFVSSLIWMLFVHSPQSSSIGLVRALFGRDSLLEFPFSSIDPIFIAFPLSFVTIFVVSMFTAKMDKEHLEKCFARTRS